MHINGIHSSSRSSNLLARIRQAIAIPIWLEILVLASTPLAVVANIAGGGAGEGPNVTVLDNRDGTVTLGNGLVSIVIVKETARLNALYYTHKFGGQTSEILLGKGQYYYGGFSLGDGKFAYSLAADPAGNGGGYADVKLLSSTESSGTMEVHFCMLRGSRGFYSTAIMSHRAQDQKGNVGAWGVVTRVMPLFNWLSADEERNFLIGTPSKNGVKVPNSPHEITVNLDGAQAGTYADKFIYGQDHADLRAWGWSSVGSGGLNVGMWMMTNMDFSDGGPMKRDVSVYPYSELNNSILTGELGMGSDGDFAPGEAWSKTCGPWFIYLNDIPPSITDAREAAQRLYKDALEQADAEKKAWPYSWFKNSAYAPESGRGTVTGKMVIDDKGNPNASAAGIWVGLEEQPLTTHDTYDFQKWLKPYQYWVQTDKNGNFTIPHVLPSNNYTLWAYGPGAAGTFMSQDQKGGNPPLELDVPSTPFHVSVNHGSTTALRDVTWTPKRIGPTVFEMGTPNRKADEFRHGDDYWAPELPPKLGYPTPVWGGQMEFPRDFENGMTFIVGKGRWATDWNYCLPAAADATGTYQPCIGTIDFDLVRVPDSDATASLYIGCAGDDGGKVIVSVNDANLGETQGVAAAPDAIEATGFDPAYSDDSSIHFGCHGPFSDERINFPARMLHAGKNTITIKMNARSLTNYLMIDYLRLELRGYVPPSPKQVIGYPGNSRVLLRWPLVTGAESYRVMRSSGPESAPVQIGGDVVSLVGGSGPSCEAFTDTTAANGTQYVYQVESINSTGHSALSPATPAVTPEPAIPSTIPAAPAALRVTRSGHHLVQLSWTASAGANYYTIWLAATHSDGVGGSFPLKWTLIDDETTAASYTDTSPTDGRTYNYSIEATNAAGTSAPSAVVSAKPVPVPPSEAPRDLAGHWQKTRNGMAVVLNWSAVPGATGYVIYRSTGDEPTFEWPTNFRTALGETTYTDEAPQPRGKPHVDLKDIEYSYQVTAVNAGGISPSATVHISAH
jgi:rhamnogalacturonan endolyase